MKMETTTTSNSTPNGSTGETKNNLSKSKPGHGWAKCRISQAQSSCDCCPDRFMINENEHDDLLSALSKFPELDDSSKKDQ
jgi:hypothetical protein